MKRSLIPGIFLLSISHLLSAQAPTPAKIGIYADSLHTTTGFCAFDRFYDARVDFWIWVLPGDNGVAAVQFAIEYPDNVTQGWVTYNSDNAIFLGSPFAGTMVAYFRCQTDWQWVLKQSIVITNLRRTKLEILPHPNDDGLVAAICDKEFSVEPLEIMSELHLNQDDSGDGSCVRPVELLGGPGDTSWGLIKSLFR